MKTRTLIARSLLTALALIVGAIALLLGWRAWRQMEIRHAIAIHSSDGIASIEQVQLGGVAQWIQIRGRHLSNPLLLMLHGGPGLPEMPYEFVNAELEKHFVVVEWDQRDAGKSFSRNLSLSSLTLDQLVHDAEQLVDLLRARFGQSKVILVGHSTGTVIGVLLAQKRPDVIRAYVGISQIANLRESERILYQFALESATRKGNEEATNELKKIGEPPFTDLSELQTCQKWVNHFAPDQFGALAPARLKLTFISPAYSLLDLWRFGRGAKVSFQRLWRDFFAVNLSKQVPRLEVPVYFFEGRDDHVVTTQVAAEYFKALDAPMAKSWIWFEHSAHWPQLEEPAKFQNEMIHRVLKETSP